jgi:hypothetical protein
MAKKNHAHSPFEEQHPARRALPIVGLAALSLVTLLVVWLAMTRF